MRILSTLSLEGFVRKTDERFTLGPALIGLGSAAKDAFDIRGLALPFLREVTELTGETSHLAVPSSNRSLIVEVYFSPHPISSSRGPGAQVEMHCSATGKCFLAYNHGDDLGSVLSEKDLFAHTPRTITSMEHLQVELKTVRKNGYAVDEQEFFEGVRCLAAPVFDGDNYCVAAIGITASTMRFTLDRIHENARIIKEASRKLSSGLGWRPEEPAKIRELIG